MNVAVTELRSHLSDWLTRVREGDNVVITEHGVPIARIVRIDYVDVLQDLLDRGVISKPAVPNRPRSTPQTRIRASQSASDLVIEQRG